MQNFEKTKFAQFMASPAGKITRIVAGAELMALGATQASAKNKASRSAKTRLIELSINALPMQFCLHVNVYIFRIHPAAISSPLRLHFLTDSTHSSRLNSSSPS